MYPGVSDKSKLAFHLADQALQPIFHDMFISDVYDTDTKSV